MQEKKERFIALLRSSEREGIDSLIEWLERSDFFSAPASTRFHGAEPGGLLSHSLNVYDEIERLHNAYPEINVAEDSLVIASLLHDICKANFYKVEKRNRKNDRGVWESYDAYTIDEKFKFGGHGSKSMYMAMNFIKLTPEEAIAINCHMGAWDDNKYLNGVYEEHGLAWLLHVADEAASYIVEAKSESN